MLIMVAGLPGSGKTYFAERLAQRLKGVHLSSDRVRKKRNARGRYSFEERLEVYREMAEYARNLLRSKKTVIVDATFEHSRMRNLFFDEAQKLSVSSVFILVYADENLIRERIRAPRPDSEADFGVYEKIRDRFEPITFPHLALQSTNDNIDDMLNRALTYIATRV